MPSSVPYVMGYLYDGIKVRPECAAPVAVSLGRGRRADTVVSIGVDPDDDESETEVIKGDLGASSDRETPEVPCMIRARRVASDPNEAMRTAITDAFTIFDAVVAFLREDPRLGGQVAGDARVASYRVRMPTGQGESGEGRTARIYFTVTWSHFL